MLGNNHIMVVLGGFRKKQFSYLCGKFRKSREKAELFPWAVR